MGLWWNCFFVLLTLPSESQRLIKWLRLTDLWAIWPNPCSVGTPSSKRRPLSLWTACASAPASHNTAVLTGVQREPLCSSLSWLWAPLSKAWFCPLWILPSDICGHWWDPPDPPLLQAECPSSLSFPHRRGTPSPSSSWKPSAGLLLGISRSLLYCSSQAWTQHSRYSLLKADQNGRIALFCSICDTLPSPANNEADTNLLV